jgi:hypothetical protein
MKQFNVFVATLVLTCFAFLPTMAHADDLDGLDVTMEVMDDISDIGDTISEMRGPEDGDAPLPGGDDVSDREGDESEESLYGDFDGEESGEGEDEFGDVEDEFEAPEDDFGHDDDFDESDLDEDDDFEDEEGEDVDDDEFDEDEFDDDDDDDDMDDDGV